MILSDFTIQEALRLRDIITFPEVDIFSRQIQPASLELQLGEDLVLGPEEFRLSHTLQVVTLSRQIAAQLNGKSSWARKGLMIHSTGGWIDPGFSGQIVLELKNIGNQLLRLAQGDWVAQLVFHRLDLPAVRTYGHEDLGSHYQGQRGNTPSWLDKLDT